jgi:hypothetical protein
MQQLRSELDRARTALAAATETRARCALEGVVLTLEWAIEDGGRASPSEVASRLHFDPLDHDEDGKKGGSRKGRTATARKTLGQRIRGMVSR